MTMSTKEEDSGPGAKAGTAEHIAVIRERLKATDKRVDELWGDVDEMSDAISDVRKVQIGQGTKLETVIEFHSEIKRYARWAIMGVFGLVALQVINLVIQKPPTNQTVTVERKP